jgi:hypothetical protein
MHHIIGLIPFLPAIAVIGLITVAFLWLLGALLIAALKWRRERRAPATRQKKFPKRIGFGRFTHFPEGSFFYCWPHPDWVPLLGYGLSLRISRTKTLSSVFQTVG